MKKIILFIAAVCITAPLLAQNNGRADQFYTISGIGFVFPVGETSDYLSPKFSSTLGANIGLGSGGLFLYPKVNLFTYGFDQRITDPAHPVLVEAGRASTYLLNVNLGYRKNSGNMSYYGFIGGGGGLVLTQQAYLNGGKVVLSNKNNGTATMEVGGGIEYRLGTFILFTEASYLHGFSDLENLPFNSVPLSVGFKTDLSKVFRKKG